MSMFELRQKIIAALPPGELEWGVFGRIRLKTGYSLGPVDANTQASPDELQKVKAAAEEILGKTL